MFGRKGLNPSPVEVSTLEQVGAAQGHVATLEHAQVAGEFFFELLYQQMAQAGDPVGIENFLGLLAAAGGVSCIATALCEYETIRMRPHDPDLLFEREVGGRSYFMGDLPTRYLFEHSTSLLNIALAYAIKHGAQIEHDFLHEPIKHALNSIGTSDFGVPRLPRDHTPNALPIELALCAWPQADHSFDAVCLAVEYRPAALGFAIGKAIDLSAQSLDPLIIAKIVVECAVPMATVDPSQFLGRLNEIRANSK